MDYLYAIASISSALAAVLAWVAKIYWSKEHIAAKDETIRAKEAQITLLDREVESLRELTPMKIREYFTSVKTQLEEYNDSLKTQIEEARREISEKQSNIDALRASGSQQQGDVERLSAQKSSIEDKANNLEAQVLALKKKYEESDQIMIKMPRIDSATLTQITRSSEALRNSLTHFTFTQPENFARLSASLAASMNAFRHLETLKMPKGLLSPQDSSNSEGEGKTGDDSYKSKT